MSLGPCPSWCAASGRADEGDEQEDDDEDAARDRDAVPLQPEPDLLPVAAGLDRLDVLAELAVGLDRDRGGEAGAGGEEIAVVRRGHCGSLDVRSRAK